jgi:hypothetical protein
MNRRFIRHYAEMVVAMFAGMLVLGVIEDFGTLMTLEHVVMLPAMLLAMLLRREEYSGHHAQHALAG